ncbi:MAG TPA: TIGR03435 family protein [Bryobacteraceae bacterium]|nr:TIGR03435 family protein [Bryobacteraceae bacterium]
MTIGATHPARWAALSAAILIVLLIGIGSAAPPAEPEFNAASIRPWKPNPGGGSSRSGNGLPAPDGGHLQFTPGRVATPWTGVTARRIILEAWGVSNFRVSGGPAWIDTDMYKLEARSMDPSAPESQLRLMLQTLLSRRMHLVLHHATREMPVYALTVGKSGPKLHEWTNGADTEAARNALQAAFASGASDAFIAQMTPFVERMNDDRTNLHPGMIGIDRPVEDRTGLKGTYLFALRPVPEEDYKTVVENQLGLKFVPRKAPVDTLVIDQIERPDPN